jgi:hypothetical protein
MRDNTAQKRRSTDHEGSLLCMPDILQRILSFVGPGHWHFLSTVSTWVREDYRNVDSMQVPAYCTSTQTVICFAQMTLYSSIFTSASRVKLAHESGLDCKAVKYEYAAGRHADTTTLAAAHELGMDLQLQQCEEQHSQEL